jgi:hypothetical protein
MSERITQPRKMPALRCLAALLLAIALPLASPAQDRSPGQDPDALQFIVDSDSSWLRVRVYRAGLLRGLGHNHVVSHNAITGLVIVGQDPLQSKLNLEFEVGELAVDDPHLRTLAGPDFPGQVPEKDIAGTRANMLGRKLLQAEQYPLIQIRSEKISGSLPELEIEASVIVRGAEFAVMFPARVELSGDSLVASGELEITHGDLGLKPFKAALGTLQVRDALLLQYEISGTRNRGPSKIHFIP